MEFNPVTVGCGCAAFLAVSLWLTDQTDNTFTREA